MSDSRRPSRLPLVATGFAVVAIVVALIAAVTVIRRDEPTAVADKRAPAVPALLERRVQASDVIKLRDQAELVVEAGQTKGMRVTDPALAQALGLEDGDVIIAFSGRELVRSSDLRDAIMRTRDVTTLYIEIVRASTPALLRWQLDGDIARARIDSLRLGSTPPSAGVIGGPLAPDPVTPDPSDPRLDTIEQIDDGHFRVPRATVDAWIANPMAISRGARVVPSVKNGKANGFKLYAIRPSSVYARLGLMNGDTLQAINGYALESPDDALEAYTNIRAASTITVELTRRGRPVTLTYEITK